jgi:hypothetical protein
MVNLSSVLLAIVDVITSGVIISIRPPGRPPLKKENIDRKPATRQWQELSGEFDDDREELVRAIQSAVNFSAKACSVGFWKEVEPYFAYLTSADIWYLHQQTRELEIDNTALQVPSNGDQLLKVQRTLFFPLFWINFVSASLFFRIGCCNV